MTTTNANFKVKNGLDAGGTITGTGLSTTSTSFNLLNTTATTINFAGAVTGTNETSGLIIGNTSTSATSWINIGTTANTSGTKNINIGTNTASLGTSIIKLGSNVSGSTSQIFLNGAYIYLSEPVSGTSPIFAAPTLSPGTVTNSGTSSDSSGVSPYITGGPATNSSTLSIGTATGGNLTIQGGFGLNGSDTTGNAKGGNLYLYSGAATQSSFSGSGNATAGNVILDTGYATANGGGITNGTISIGTARTSSITLGRTGINTTVNGYLGATYISAPASSVSGNIQIYALGTSTTAGSLLIGQGSGTTMTINMTAPYHSFGATTITAMTSTSAASGTNYAGNVFIYGGQGGGTNTIGGNVFIDGGQPSVVSTGGTVYIGTNLLGVNVGNSWTTNGVVLGQLNVTPVSLAGTTTASAPFILTTGTSSTAEGAIGYDGVGFYQVNSSFKKAATVSSYIYKKATTTTIANSTANQSIISGTTASASTGITLLAGTTYEFEVRFVLNTTGTTSHTESVGFYYSGTTSYYNYEIERKVSNVATSATYYTQIASGTTLTSNLTNTVMTPAITTSQTNVIYIYRGWVTTNTAGNWTPIIKFSASPNTTSSIEVGTTVKLTPLQSTSGTVNIGTWA